MLTGVVVPLAMGSALGSFLGSKYVALNVRTTHTSHHVMCSIHSIHLGGGSQSVRVFGLWLAGS